MNGFELLWSLLAISGGLSLLIFRESFIKGNERAFRLMYEKTQFPLFKLQAENMDSTYMRMVSVLVAVILIGVGTITILQNV